MKDIIVNLAKDLEARDRKSLIEWTAVPVERFLSTDNASTLVRRLPQAFIAYSLQFCSARCTRKGTRRFLMSLTSKSKFLGSYHRLICFLRSEDEGFSRQLVIRLIESLETQPLPHLTPNEQAHLSVLIQTTLEVRGEFFSSVSHTCTD